MSDDVYGDVVRGGLSLKKKIKKKKKKKKSKERKQKKVDLSVEEPTEDQTMTIEERDTQHLADIAKTKTKAELSFEARLKAQEEKTIAKAVKKTHRQRIEEFNEYLGSLSEHNDIPKVGPG